MDREQKKFTKTEKSWILYDWANSVYATNIMAVIFPIYFGNVCAAAGADNLVLWSYGTSAAHLPGGCAGPHPGVAGRSQRLQEKAVFRLHDPGRAVHPL